MHFCFKRNILISLTLELSVSLSHIEHFLYYFCTFLKQENSFAVRGGNGPVVKLCKRKHACPEFICTSTGETGCGIHKATKTAANSGHHPRAVRDLILHGCCKERVLSVIY